MPLRRETADNDDKVVGNKPDLNHLFNELLLGPGSPGFTWKQGSADKYKGGCLTFDDSPFGNLLAQAQTGSEGQKGDAIADVSAPGAGVAEKFPSAQDRALWTDLYGIPNDLQGWDLAKRLYKEGVDRNEKDLLRDAIRLMHQELSRQPDKSVAEQDLYKGLRDYVLLLANPKRLDHGDMHNTGAKKNSDESNKAIAEALELARRYKMPPLEQAALMRAQGNNQLVIATIKEIADKKPHLDDLRSASTSFGRALSVITGQNSNQDIATRAAVQADLAYTEWQQSKDPSNRQKARDAINAEKHFKAAIDSWDKFDPKREPNAQQATDDKDKNLVLALTGYAQSLEARGQKREAAEQSRRADLILSQRHLTIDEIDGWGRFDKGKDKE